MKKKFNYSMLLTSLTIASILTVGSLWLCSSTTNGGSNQIITNNQVSNIRINNKASQPITSTNIGKQIGNIRHWLNNNFSGVELENGGFVALTGTNSVTRIDMFGNIIWEFDPSKISTNIYSGSSDFSSKKVVEIVQDQSNFNIFYLLLVPTQVPEELKDVDGTDPTYYDQMKSSTNYQATIVQIQENIDSYSGNIWSPSFQILNHANISPQKMVDNYPSSWKNGSDDQNTFFAKADHPSWYVTQSGDKVSPAPSTSGSESTATQESTVQGTTMVLPWKQYVTNLGNMYARDNKVFIFGGNGSIYNDPEALSIGVWRISFNLNQTPEVTGIPYAYLLSGLKYEPSYNISSGESPNLNWNQSYAPIGQTSDFHYVPRLAVAGIQTNVSSNKQTFLYLAGGITVGQIANSQTRDDGVNPTTQKGFNTYTTSGSSSTSSQVKAKNLQEKRSLQLSGQNILSNPQNPDRNSIDPCLLFGTALNISALMNMPTTTTTTSNSFTNILQDNNYFDVGATIGTSSTTGTYYFFSDKSDTTSSSSSVQVSASQASASKRGTVTNDDAFRRAFPKNNNPADLIFGQVKKIDEFKNNNVSGQSQYSGVIGQANASYSWNLNLLAENARNYYYPTLAFGHSLKNVGSLIKVKTLSNLNNKATLYGYAMQVGTSIVFVNEPKFDATSIVYHGPSIVSLGDNSLIGTTMYKNNQYEYGFKMFPASSAQDANSVQARNNKPFSSSGDEAIDNAIISIGVASFVGGIKDLNDTVPMITSTFNISQDPYIDGATSYKQMTKTTKPTTLSWNTYKGLSIANNGNSLSSLWSNSTDNTKNFVLTSNPLLSEYSQDVVWKNKLFYAAMKQENGSTVLYSRIANNSGPKRIFFESLSHNDTTSTGNQLVVPSSFNVPTTIDTKNEYYVPANPSTSNQQFDITLSPSFGSNNTDYFFGQLGNSIQGTSRVVGHQGISYRSLINSYGQVQYTTQASLNRNELLGQGEFYNSLSDSILSNPLGAVLQTVNVSSITNELENQFKVQIVKPEYVSQFFNITKSPEIDPNNQPTYGPVLLIARNVNYLEQTATITAYAWNKLSGQYDIMPRTSSNLLAVNNSVFSGFSAMASWVLPVGISVPLVIVALVVALGCAIGIPMSKHKKSMKMGFEMQNEKVNTLTTAVGGVFKKIIDTTSADKMKAKPQMLNSGSPKPAPSPTSPKPNVAPKPANPTPSAPKQFTKSAPPKPN